MGAVVVVVEGEGEGGRDEGWRVVEVTPEKQIEQVHEEVVQHVLHYLCSHSQLAERPDTAGARSDDVHHMHTQTHTQKVTLGPLRSLW